MPTKITKRKRISYDKLVRDKVPAQLQEKSIPYSVKTLGFSEFKGYLARKVQEEIDELITSKGKKNRAEELADVFEVLEAYALAHGISLELLAEVRRVKLQEKGGFENRTCLLWIEE